MKKILIFLLFANSLCNAQVIRIPVPDTIYWYNGDRLGIMVASHDKDYNQYPYTVIDSTTGNATPGDSITIHARTTDIDGDATYTQYRFGYSADSLGAITWLTDWQLDSVYTIPDSLAGDYPYMAARGKALTGGRTGRSVAVWGDSIISETLSDYIDSMQFWSGELDFANNRWLDKSGNNNHLRLVQSNCLSVDSSHYINQATIPANLKFANTETFTIKLTFTITEFKTATWQGLFSIGAISNGVTIGVYNNDLKFYFGTSKNQAQIKNISLNTTYECYFVRDPYLTWNGTNNTFIYANSDSVRVSNPNATPTYANDNYGIGNLVGFTLPLDGIIYDVQVYDTIVNPVIANTFTPLYWWPMSEGYGNYVHEVVNDTRHEITNAGAWAKQDSVHYNWQYGASKIKYGTDSVYVPYTITGDTIYDAAYITANGNYLNASETVTACVTSGSDYPPVETRVQVSDTLIDHQNFWYTEGVKNQKCYNDFKANWNDQNYQMSNATGTNKSDIVIWDEPLFDDLYLQVYDLFGIDLAYNEIDVPGDYATLTLALASISDNTSMKRYNINLLDSINETSEVVWKDYVSLIGVDTATSIVTLINPDDVDSATLVNSSVIRVGVDNGVYFSNVKLMVENGRYALHSDASTLNTTDRPIFVSFTDCSFIHLGNTGSETVSGEMYWPTKDACGMGFCDNQRYVFKGCYANSKDGVSTKTNLARGFSIHAKTTAGMRSFCYLTDCTFKCATPQIRAMRIGMLYNNQDFYSLDNVRLITGNLLINGTGTYDSTVTNDGEIFNGTIICD